jgi:hypothetical protein
LSDKPNINMRIQPDKSALFDARDGVTIRVAFDSPTQVKVEMWREVKDDKGEVSGMQRVAPDVGNIGTKAFRERLLKSAREVFNPPSGESKDDKQEPDTIPSLGDDLESVSIALGIPDVSELLKPESGTTVVDRLVELAEEIGTLFTTPSGRAHISVEVEDHTETYSLDDAPFAEFLTGHFYITEKERLQKQAEASYESLVASLGGMVPEGFVRMKRPPVVKPQAVSDAITQLKSIAKVEKRVEQVWLRVGGHGGKHYLDLCNDEWEVVETDEDGWRVVKNPPVKFVRAAGMLELSHPEEGGSLDDLKDLLNIKDISEDEDSKRNWSLMLAWLLQAMRPDPQHPILALKGGEGTAKSFTAFLLRSLADPHDSPDDYQPSDLRTFCIWAEHEWVVALDNISSMPEWLSNAMCKMVTGMGFKVRTLYSDRGLQIFKARRPITINGIADIGTNRDLLSRSLLLNLPVITKYQLESEVLEKFEARRAGILGCLLDAMSAGMRKLPDLQVEGRGTRMPDFDLWGRATEEALGFEEGDFLRARGQGEREAIQSALEAEPIAVTIERFAAQYTQSRWEGQAQELLELLNDLESDDQKKRSREWPKSASALGAKLAKLQSALRVEGVYVEKVAKGSQGKRGLQVYYRNPEEAEEDGDGDEAPGGRPEEGATKSATKSATSENPTDNPNTEEGGRGGRGGTPKPAQKDDEAEDGPPRTPAELLGITEEEYRARNKGEVFYEDNPDLDLEDSEGSPDDEDVWEV